MAHLRKRHVLSVLTKMAGLWPVAGVLGLRQSGKSTLLRDLLGISNIVTLDDEEVFDDVSISAKNFLAKMGTPLAIDEAQKRPALFDAIKLNVDRRRRPGTYFLTGSSQFSAKLGIRESLTGRIGLVHLYPFTLSEAHQDPYEKGRLAPFHKLGCRYDIETLMHQLPRGGLPVPLFLRDDEHRAQYFRSWFDTSVMRDAARSIGGAYDADFAWSILRQLGQALREGEFPTVSHFKQDSRKVKNYLEAFAIIFLLRKIPCHEAGVGRDCWLPSDSGLAAWIMGTSNGEGATLTLARVFVMNEILATAECGGSPLHATYYKSARGAPVDLIWDDVLVKISNAKKTQLSYDERPLEGALKTLRLKRAVLCTPYNSVEIAKTGISHVPWSYWS